MDLEGMHPFILVWGEKKQIALLRSSRTNVVWYYKYAAPPELPNRRAVRFVETRGWGEAH